MKLQFKEQQFQIDAVSAVINCFKGQQPATKHFSLQRSKNILQKAKDIAKGIPNIEFNEDELHENIGYRNAALQITESQIIENIQQVQSENDIVEIQQLEKPNGINLGYNLTIEMETGTGKTYTYIRTMLELNKKYGWSKFIIIVPSIAIREGVYKSFEITKEHFQEIYNTQITPFIYNSARPQDIETFASDKRVSVMIINTQAFASRGADARRIYNELDQFGSRKPIEIIAQTNPIIIIDETQAVEGEVALQSIQNFKPLFTLRYSATHRIDYNKVFRLDALDAYNRKLVKKIQVKGISLKGTTGTNAYLYLENIIISKDKPPVASVEFEIRASGETIKRQRKKLSKGANLFELSGDMPQYHNFVIQEIDAYQNKIVVNGIDIYAGEVIGDYYENDFRRIQIRETIFSHLKKEKQLYDKGIKVLSLFFIDAVEKYKKYNDAGEEIQGDYAVMFEEEYDKIKNDFIDLFHQEYNDYLKNTDPHNTHKGYLPTNYFEYLERDSADKIHNGYFSIDRKNKMINPSVRRGTDQSDDASAYDLIIKDKERLLSFEEPTRFIFSHSALKEGWDNPNVFQICALKHSDANIRRRQEVGRGMRLCVNNNGIRLDYDAVGEQVHDINRLTVIASESYEQFANGLQTEIASSIKNRPVKADKSFFAGKLITDHLGQTIRINDETANKLNKFLYKNDILDEDDKLTQEGKLKIENNTLPLPENLLPFREDLTNLLKSIYTGDPYKIEDDRKNVEVSVNKNFYKKEFQDLWNKINIKSIYEVQFDSVKLIEDAKNRINKDLHISDRTYEVKEGILGNSTKEELERHDAIVLIERNTKKIGAEILYTHTTYDIIGEMVNSTNLKRTTIVEILKKIKPNTFYLVQKNPEEFIAKCAKLINETKASLIINNIVYHKTDERFDAKTIFTNTRETLRQSEILKKHIYDYLVTDSKIETEFAKALEESMQVSVYAKLPKEFYITTPIARYSPDWAIVFDKEKVRQIYFVAETKGSDSEMELRPIENLKIHCAGEHFKTISNSEVKFVKISTYDKLLDLIQLK